MPASAVDPQNVVVTEPVRDSDHAVHLTYVELLDGVYAPIGLRLPSGEGPFPLVLFAAGNGGGGMAGGSRVPRKRGWSPEPSFQADYTGGRQAGRAQIA